MVHYVITNRDTMSIDTCSVQHSGSIVAFMLCCNLVRVVIHFCYDGYARSIIRWRVAVRPSTFPVTVVTKESGIQVGLVRACKCTSGVHLAGGRLAVLAERIPGWNLSFACRLSVPVQLVCRHAVDNSSNQRLNTEFRA
jgi:hypothetical protein